METLPVPSPGAVMGAQEVCQVVPDPEDILVRA